MCHTGGEEEAEAAYDEAFHAIFQLQLERHRHTQPYTSKKDGRSKWAMIEMSPITVSSYTTIPQAQSHAPVIDTAAWLPYTVACHDVTGLQCAGTLHNHVVGCEVAETCK